jgi:hypothetical protein
VHLRAAAIGHHGRHVEDDLGVEVRVVGRQITCVRGVSRTALDDAPVQLGSH